MALSIFPTRVPTLANLNVFQPYERIQHWVPGHQFWTLAQIADAAGIRHQGCRLGEGDSWVAVTDQRLSDSAVGTHLLRPPV